MADEVTGRGARGLPPLRSPQYKTVERFCQGGFVMERVIETVAYVAVFAAVYFPVRAIIDKVFKSKER